MKPFVLFLLTIPVIVFVLAVEEQEAKSKAVYQDLIDRLRAIPQ